MRMENVNESYVCNVRAAAFGGRHTPKSALLDPTKQFTDFTVRKRLLEMYSVCLSLL